MGLSVSVSLKQKQQQQPPHRWKCQWQQQQKQQRQQTLIQQQHILTDNRNHQQQNAPKQQQQCGQKQQQIQKQTQQPTHSSCLSAAATTKMLPNKSCSKTAITKFKSPAAASNILSTATTILALATTTRTKTFSWLFATFLFSVLLMEPTAAATTATNPTHMATTTTTTKVAAAATIAADSLRVAATTTANSATITQAALELTLMDEAAAAVIDGLEQDDSSSNNTIVPSNSNSHSNSNEQQLLQIYKNAQQHRHRQRAAPAPPESFDDIEPTAGVVSTLASTLVVAAATTTTTAATSSGAAAANAIDADAKCEPKVLEEIPAQPIYDFADLAEDAARQFTDFLSAKFSGSVPPPLPQISEELREEVRRRANGIANYALSQDVSLMAFAIAAPSIHTVVVKFRDNVTIPPDQIHNKAFLGSYWRELGFAWNSTEGAQEWGAPFRDCNLLKGRWLWPFRISFTEHQIKIVAAAFIAADRDLCNDGLEEVFGRRHGCDRNTTFCRLNELKPTGTARDRYFCLCRESYYLPNATLQGFRGDIVESSEGFDNYSCMPCPGGCSKCDQHGVCYFGEPQEAVSMNNLLRVSVGSVLGACILCCIVMGVIVFRQRKCKAIASGMWTVLETILLGIVLLYAAVAVHFFGASTERCLLEPWLRELGFVTCYGAIILKLYRHLVDFRTRKAHRWVLRDVDLLKYLGTMVFAVICYMAAFTASSLDLIETAQLGGLSVATRDTCLPLKWELVTQVSEMLILCFGLHLALASRNANTQFRDRQFLVATLTIEFLVSSCYYILRYFYLQELSPGALLLTLFLRSQLTNTISLGLIFVPKLWYQHKQVRSLAHDLSIRLPVDAFKGSHDVGHHLGGGYAGLCLGDPDIGELTISEMSPEDIRAELKRLYTQLEILKNKTLRQDNPHISKRRGGRKAGHRRFSLQALSAKHRSNKHHQDVEITEAEPSRTPEDSVCSAEGPTDTYAEISGISHSMLSHSAVSHSVVSHSVVSHVK